MYECTVNEVLLPWAERRGPAGRRWSAAVASWCRGGETLRTLFYQRRSLMSKLLSWNAKKKKILNSFCSRSFRCSDRPSLHQEDSKSEREKLFLVNWRRRRRRSGGGARHLGKFSGEACHSSHHHFSPSTTTTSSSSSSVALNSSAVSLLPQAWSEHCEKKEKKRKKKRRKGGCPVMQKWERSHPTFLP